MRYRFNSSAYKKLSKRQKVVYWCWQFSFLGLMCFYALYVFPKTLHRSLHTEPEIDFVTSMVWYFFVPMMAICVLYALLNHYVEKLDRRDLDERVKGLNGKSLTPEYFLESRSVLSKDDFTGIYVLHNVTKDLYYVGQGVRVYERLTQHFMGRGNADVYADWKYGDRFEIEVIPLEGSGYQSLNDLERDAIKSYDAYEKGYNRTRGNAR